MNLEEQLDDMAVRASEDAANLHTLQIQVDTLDEGTHSLFHHTSPFICTLACLPSRHLKLITKQNRPFLFIAYQSHGLGNHHHH